MNDQISFIPMLEPRDTSFEDNERKASQICDEEFWRADGDIVKYVAACVDRYFLVSNGYYSVVCEWRLYWNNEPFCGDKNCDVVKYWMPLPFAPKEEQ